MTVFVVGAINLDIVATVRALPRPGETILAEAVRRFVGGKGANQAVAAARAGAPTRMIGCVGADADGDFLLDYLRNAAIHTEAVRRDTQIATGTAFIAVAKDAENTVIVSLGANAELSVADVLKATPQSGDTILGQLETGLDAVHALFAHAPKGVRRILNAAPARREARHLLGLCDILILNETELHVFAGLSASPTQIADIASAARILCSAGQAMIVTLGVQGALVIEGAEVWHAPAARVQPVDTVGAGDCFCGVFAAFLNEGRTLRESVALANLAASLSVQQAGAAASMPGRTAILATADACA